MRRVAVLWPVLALAGCGGAEPRPAVPEAPPLDDAADLAAMLPAGADRCAVARPARIDPVRRELFLRLAATDAIAWSADLPIAAYASATHDLPDGRRAKVILIRLAGPDLRLRERISDHAPVGLRWDEPAARCRGAGCSLPRASVLEPRTVRIDEGTWPVPGEARVREDRDPAAELRCLELAAREPEALEVQAHGGGEGILGEGATLPADVVTRADGRRIERTKRVRVGSPQRARAALAAHDASALTGLLPGVAGAEQDALVERDAIVFRMRVLWEDLELAVEDERRLAAIAAVEERRRTPIPPEDVVVSDLAAAREQIDLRAGALGALVGAARRGAVAQLRVLLVRTLAAHPTDARSARMLVRLLLDEGHEPDVALGVIEAFLAREPADAERWRLLRREALAQRGPDALAPALEADGIVLRGEGRRAAAAMIAMRARGTEHEWAEGAWTAASALERRAAAVRMRPAAHPGALLLATLPEALDVLAELAGAGPPPASRGVFLLVRAPGSVADTAATEGWIEVADARGRAAWLGASPGAEPQRLRALGVGLAAALAAAGEGARVDLAFAVLLPGGARGADAPLSGPVLRLAGRVEAGALRIERAGAGAADARWDEVARWIAEPLLTVEHRTFPPPEASFQLRDPAELGPIAAAAAARGLGCEEIALRVSCVAPPGDPGAARRLVADVARATLGADAARLVP